MSLPFEPEPIESLRQRYPEALKKIWSVVEIETGLAENENTDRPGLHRKHIFDFEDGWRLIVSKESLQGCGIKDIEDAMIIHISTSCTYKHHGAYTLEDVENDSIAHWWALSSMDHITPNFLGLSNNKVAHLYIPLS